MRAIHHSFFSHLALQNQDREAIAIQDRQLPCRLVRIQGVECFGQCRRCGVPGGDFFDFLTPNSRELMVGVGNIPMHGMAAAILLSGLQASLRSIGSRDPALPSLAGELNRMLWEIAPENTFVSFFGARVSPRSRQLRYVNAGCPVTVAIRSGGRAEWIEPNGAPFGLSRRSSYHQRTIGFEPGDTLIAATEGAEEGVRDILRNGAIDRVRELPGKIIEAAESLRGPALLDRTVIVIHYNRANGDTVERAPASRSLPALRMAAAA